MFSQESRAGSIPQSKRSVTWQSFKSVKSQAESRSGLIRVNPAERFLGIHPLGDRNSPVAVTNTSTPSPVHGLNQILYHPLDFREKQFRLLELMPGPQHRHISCRLFTSDLHLHPAYVALSYTWSNSSYLGEKKEDKKFSIELNGQHFPVMENLFLALSQVRSLDIPRIFWIDAICINQSDRQEKNHQVKLMKRIYRESYSVIVWLGPERHHSSKVMELIARIAQEQDPHEKRRIVLRAMRDKSYDFFRAYKMIFKRSYWYRTWIVQEIFSAKQLLVYCGPRSVNWDSFVAFQRFLATECHGGASVDGQQMESMSNLHLWIQKGVVTREDLKKCISNGDRFLDLAKVRNSGFKSQESEDPDCRSLYRLLFDNWDAMASDPRDKVFAIFRLASDGNLYRIIVDYELSVCQIYTNIVESYIRIYGNLSIILPRRFVGNSYHLPTWCPDWSSQSPASKGNWIDADPFHVPAYLPPYCAAGLGSPPRVHFSVQGQVMNVWGWRVDTIRQNSQSRDLPPPVIIQKEKLFDFSRLFLMLLFFRESRPQKTVIRKVTEFDIWYAMYRRELHPSFSSGVRSHRIKPGRDPSRAFARYCREKHDEFFKTLLRATNFIIDEKAKSAKVHQAWMQHADIPDRFSSPMEEVMTSKLRAIATDIGDIRINENYACFFNTRKGYMGLGPRDMRNDDLVCILRGCNLPVVLRCDGFSFRLIGPAYVARLMHGQFFNLRHSRSSRLPEEEEFIIF